MKAVIIGEPSGASREAIMAVYPRHKAVVDAFKARGEVIGIGPFADLGNMGIFRTREAAEEFAKQDPFILEGLIKSADLPNCCSAGRTKGSRSFRSHWNAIPPIGARSYS